MSGRQNMRPERVCSFVVLLKNQRQEYEHTNSDVGNEKTESGVAEAVGSGARASMKSRRVLATHATDR
jgi:hypothetical protein